MTTGEVINVASEVQGDLQQLKPNVLLETIKGCVPGLMTFGYRLGIAFLIIFFGFKIVKKLKKYMERMLEKTGFEVSITKFLVSVADAILHALVILVAAEKIGIPSASIVALLGSAGLAIGLALQGSLANLAGSILILIMKPFVVGDYIVANGIEGSVDCIGLIYTTLMTIDNKKITIPNGSISNTTVTNVTASHKRRIDIEVGISYTSDIRLAKEVMEKVYASQPGILKDEDITVYVGELGESSVVIGGRGWFRTEDYWTSRWAILEQVKIEYDKAGVEIPFNQLDVHIHQ